MKFEAIAKSGIITDKITEDTATCYFTDKYNAYGATNDLLFFANHQIIDLKLKQKFIQFFQYKTASHSLLYEHECITYNIGFITEDMTYTYKYTMQICNNISIIAEKLDHDQIIDKRIVEVK